MTKIDGTSVYIIYEHLQVKEHKLRRIININTLMDRKRKQLLVYQSATELSVLHKYLLQKHIDDNNITYSTIQTPINTTEITMRLI